MNEQRIQQTIHKLNDVICDKLEAVNNKTPTAEVKKISALVKEYKCLIDLVSGVVEKTKTEFDNDTPPEGIEIDEELDEEVDLLLQSGILLSALYTLIDWRLVKQGKMQWVCDDTLELLEILVPVFKGQIKLPIIKQIKVVPVVGQEGEI